MSEVKLGHTSDSCRSTPGDRIAGERQRRWLSNNDFPTNPVARFLKRSVEMLPCSLSTYKAVGSLSLKAFESEFLRITFPNGTQAFVPNAWLDDIEAVIAFRSLKTKWNKRVAQTLPDWPNYGQTFKGFLVSLEAALPGHWPPLLISIVGNRFAAAQPMSIDFESQELELPVPQRRKRVPIPGRIRALLRDLRKIRRSEAGDPRRILQKTGQLQLDSIERICLDIVIAVYNRKKESFQNSERYAQGGVSLATKLSAGTAETEIWPPDLVALDFLKSVAPEFHDYSPKRRSSAPRPFVLCSPDLYFDLYRLRNAPPIDAAPLEEFVQRIYRAVLMHCGRRGCCLLSLTLGDFVRAVDPVTDEDLVDMVIRFTKGGREVPISLPLSALWPDEELKMLQTFLEKTSDFPRDTSLFSFISNDVFARHSSDLFAQLLRTEVMPAGTDCLHLPRIVFATFWPLRVACARDRTLLDHPALKGIRNNVWFSPPMLDQLLKIVGGAEIDSLEILRRILGHASTYECIKDYCRSWAIQILLAAESK